MRPLRWGLPFLAVLLIAQVLPGQHADEEDQEPSVLVVSGSPPFECSVPNLADCTALRERWSAQIELPEGMTTLVLEARAKDLTPLPVGTSDENAFALWAASPKGHVRLVATYAGAQGLERVDWPLDEPAPLGVWTFEAFAAFGGYSAFHVWDFEYALTFAFWGYELPDDYSAFPDGTDRSQPQILLGNLGVSDVIPCASTSSIRGSPAGLPLSTTNTC